MKRVESLCIVALLCIALFGSVYFQRKTTSLDQRSLAAETAVSPIYWGATVKGSTYNKLYNTNIYSDPPWDMNTLSKFEQNAGKKVSLLNIGNSWWKCESNHTLCGYKTFNYQKSQYDTIRNHGTIPFLTWSTDTNDPDISLDEFKLGTIISGKHDAFIRQFASEAKAWGYPMFMRLDWEMNGTWYKWSEKYKRPDGTYLNQPGEYIQMWRHVYDIFTEVGATNITWVWNVNTIYNSSIPLFDLYPGDSYVDWIGIDGYNWGNLKGFNDWKGFYSTFYPTYTEVTSLAPTKPIIIPETASSESGAPSGQSKSTWITDALNTQIPTNFPKIKAMMWFNWDITENGVYNDWNIESSAASQAAFADGIVSAYYQQGDFAKFSNLPKLSKIQPLNNLETSLTPTVNLTSTSTPVPPPVSNLLLNNSFESSGSTWLLPWKFDVKTGSTATVTQDSITKQDGNYSISINVTQSSSTPWNVQLKQSAISLDAQRNYTISFYAKSSSSRDLNITMQQGYSPYSEYANLNIGVTTTWQKYTLNFTAPLSDPNTMLSFNLAEASGTVWLDNIELVPGAITVTPTTVLTSTPTLKPTTSPTPTNTIAPTVTIVKNACQVMFDSNITPLKGDVNCDNKVDIVDLSILAANWGKTNITYIQGDLNSDGIINVTDLSLLASGWGNAR